ncbi:hypothetical protein LTR37_020668 [Vermiconidia calcicola]|uniref:Uncharacterized protein n=1 Tax=Vermiconidia calcicola TaxID=1690605 RepID=A0ACC3MDP9_9PEZI|nr:hypothetical protein LTR37_020668 [Vermiconidia calcicola]
MLRLERQTPFRHWTKTSVLEATLLEIKPTQAQYLTVPELPFNDEFTTPGYFGLDPFDLFGDGDAFLENVDFSSLFLPQGPGLDGASSADVYDVSNEQFRDNKPRHVGSVQPNEGNPEQHSISRFGSPLPSIRPDQRANIVRPGRSSGTSPCWKLSRADYCQIKQKLSPMSGILPNGFALPSRHTVSRYLEGCIKGLYEHMPFLHIPTWSAPSAAPDLFLAMASIGALFRFEGQAAISFFYAAKAAIAFQLRMSQDERVVGGLARAPSVYSRSDSSSPSTHFVHNPASAKLSSNGQNAVDHLQTMQAILSLMVPGSWGPRQLVGEAIAFQSVLAELVREDGLSPDPVPPAEFTVHSANGDAWRKWIRTESLRRTKLFAYTFINLQSVAYNVVPCMLTSEIQINTPASQEEWKATTEDRWKQARRASRIAPTPFYAEFKALFQSSGSGTSTPSPPSSAIANYALIFAILQCVFLLREGRATLPTEDAANSLRLEDVESLSRALQNWQNRWENSPESTIEPQSSSGPVAFNSTALLRLAWIRLHSNLGPCRNLSSRHPSMIVAAFKSCPPLQRHSALTQAIVQAAHALSIPVRLGITFVARTQTLTWSVQHSLCNLECAIFLSKWFEAVASTLAATPLTAQEAGLIYMIRSIVQETDFFRDKALEAPVDVPGWQRLLQHLATAVVTLWAEIFSGTHVFDMVSTIGNSLDIYAKLLDDAHTPINANLR